MKPKVIFILFICLALLLAACSGAGSLPLPIGKSIDPTAGFSEMQGTVEAKNPGQADFGPVADGTRLKVLGQVRTGLDSRVRLDLASGTTVRVGPNSLFVLQSNQTKGGSLVTRLVVQAGQVWVILHGGQMSVETPSGTASVQGSYMMVAVDPMTEDVSVSCLEGSCRVENPTAAMNLATGQGTSLYHWNTAGKSSPPAPRMRYLSPEEFNQFVANNPEARDALDEADATASVLPTLTPGDTSTPAAACFELLSPSSGASVAADGTLVLDWNDQPGAYKYVLTITKPNGAEKSEITWRSSARLDAASLPFAGTYQWTVTAYDSNLQSICSAGPWTFTKADSPTSTPAADCFTLDAPTEGAEVSATDPPTFTWSEQPDRYKFIITITNPDGSESSQIDFANSYELPAGSLTQGGTYTWSVTSYNSDLQPICSAGPRTFSVAGESVPTPTPGGCVTLLTPPDGTNFPDPQKVDFTWTAYPGAYKYIITFKPPKTPAYTFLAWTPIHTRFVESFTAGGTYQWWVTVKDKSLKDICTSGKFAFTKPETIIPTKTPSSDDGGGAESGDLFWNRNVSISGCTVSASADTSYDGGVKKFTISTSPVPPTSPYVVLSSLGGTTYGASVSLSDIVTGLLGPDRFGQLSLLPVLVSAPPAPLSCTTIPAGTTLYWRFEIFDGGYHLDNFIGSLVTTQDCP
ncbi:MAG TPA: FecR family protein [Anaerolineales bacterium]|nr:FecR family protein [Anaerolineales bacterium]